MWRNKERNTRITDTSPQSKNRHFILFIHTNTQTVQKKKVMQTDQDLSEHTCTIGLCLHMCKNNKAKLVKGVGGEAARQKDINSLSEFNNRGGGGGGAGQRQDGE